MYSMCCCEVIELEKGWSPWMPGWTAIEWRMVILEMKRTYTQSANSGVIHVLCLLSLPAVSSCYQSHQRNQQIWVDFWGGFASCTSKCGLETTGNEPFDGSTDQPLRYTLGDLAFIDEASISSEDNCVCLISNDINDFWWLLYGQKR